MVVTCASRIGRRGFIDQRRQPAVFELDRSRLLAICAKPPCSQPFAANWRERPHARRGHSPRSESYTVAAITPTPANAGHRKGSRARMLRAAISLTPAANRRDNRSCAARGGRTPGWPDTGPPKSVRPRPGIAERPRARRFVQIVSVGNLQRLFALRPRRSARDARVASGLAIVAYVGRATEK
jgi:hypothetical protein